MNDSYGPARSVPAPMTPTQRLPLANAAETDTRVQCDSVVRISAPRVTAPCDRQMSHPTELPTDKSWRVGERWSLSPEIDPVGRRIVFMGDLATSDALDVLLRFAHRCSIAVDVIGTLVGENGKLCAVSKLRLGQSSGGDIYHGNCSDDEKLRLIRRSSALFVSSMRWFDRAASLVSETDQTIGVLDLQQSFGCKAALATSPRTVVVVTDEATLEESLRSLV